MKSFWIHDDWVKKSIIVTLTKPLFECKFQPLRVMTLSVCIAFLAV